MKKRFLILCMLLICGVVSSQTNNYILKNLSTFDGLSQSSVIAIHQDKLGQMWFGTRDGLNKYDGSRFTIFRNNPKDSLSISNNDILSIEEDSSGKIWVGTYNGLNCYNPVTNTFERFIHSNNDNSLSNNAIWCIKEIKDEIWVGTSIGLTIFNKKSHKFSTIYFSSSEKNSLPNNYVLSILEAKNGEIWVGTSKGLCKVKSRKNGEISFETIKTENEVEPLFVQDLVEDANANIWIGSKNLGLLQFNAKSQKIISISSLEKYKIIDADVRSISIDHKGAIWVGAYDGVSIIQKDGSLHQINNDNSNNSSAHIDKVKSVYTDKKGSVWIGAYYKGVNFWDISNINFTNFNQNTENLTLSFDVIGAIAKDNNQNIYFGSEGGGITIYNKVSKKTSYIKTNEKNKFSRDDIKSLCFTADGILWIGTYKAGLLAYDTKSKNYIEGKVSASLNKYIYGTGLNAIKNEGNSILWLGTFGKGLIRYDVTEQTFQIIGNDNYSDNFLTNKRVRTLLIDKKHNIWIGTQSGLNHINIDELENKNYRINHYFFENDVLSGDDILTIFQDSNDNILVGTKAKGIFKFDNGKFKNINLGVENSRITSIHAITEDAEKNLWLSSNQGIIKYNPKNSLTIIYNKKDELNNKEFKDNSVLKIGNDQFYFGGISGVTYFDSKNIAINKYCPQVLITDFKIKNEANLSEQELENYQQNITYKNEITLSHDNANFTINFSIPNYINSGNNQYAYRLIGLDDSWTTTSNPQVSYNIKNAGSYIFEVKGANNDGLWNKKSSTLNITIKPSFWMSTWALTIYFLLFALGLYALLSILNSKNKLKQKLEIEHVESEKDKENNLAKLEFFTNISHEFRTPLTLILGPLEEILANYNGSNEMHKKLMMIDGSANHLLRLINRLMDFRKLESNQFQLQTAEGNIVKFAKEIYLSFTEHAKNGNYTYNFIASDEEILVFIDRYKFERVIFNLISNAFRYTSKGGEITVRITKNTEDITLAVEDNGIGISEEYADKIFDLFFEVPKNDVLQNDYNKGTGIGLSIVKNIVQLHKGTIKVISNKGEGSKFIVSLLIGKNHLNENEIIDDFKISDDLTQYVSQLEPDTIFEDDINDLIESSNKPTLLLVEDHKGLRSFMKDILKKDYNILQAENGVIGLQKAIKFTPDLIISDVIMPEMVGTELCSKIKENIKTSHIPVILLTSRTSLVYKFEGLESGADDYISKPFNIKEFKLKIKNLLKSSERLKIKFTNEDVFQPSELTITSMDEDLLKKAFKIVEENISNEQFDIPLFCTELGVSRTMLFLKIKAWTNFTPNEFIHEIRLKRAAQLLEQNKINISQVSYKVGFNNAKYFSKCFLKKYGKTPSQYASIFSIETQN